MITFVHPRFREISEKPESKVSISVSSTVIYSSNVTGEATMPCFTIKFLTFSYT
jgi:hypothetical protein